MHLPGGLRRSLAAMSSSSGVLEPELLEELLEPLPIPAEEVLLVPERTLKIVCIGAHPDDPESACGGTLARYAEAGHRVTALYLTRGERGIRGKTLDEAAAIRTLEAERACEILGVTALFAGQIDGETEVTALRSASFSELLHREEPDIVFTHWPLDTHPDHQVTSLLTLRAYQTAPRKFRLYFYEVNYGSQTFGFTPNIYVDVTATRERKKEALFAHVSQDGEGIYRKHHEIMEVYRGREIGTGAAESFYALPRDHRNGGLPGL